MSDTALSWPLLATRAISNTALLLNNRPIATTPLAFPLASSGKIK